MHSRENAIPPKNFGQLCFFGQQENFVQISFDVFYELTIESYERIFSLHV